MTPATTPIKAIVFDFGGVLIDWNPRYLYRQFFENDPDAMERFFTEIGFNEWNVEQDRGRSFAEAVAELTAQFPHHRDLIHAYNERWEESIGGPIQATVDVLRDLHEAGYTLHALSNWSAETFSRVRPQYEFLNWFQTIVLSGEERLVKPDPQIFEVLLQKVNLSAADCLFIDDSAANIETAQRLGFVTVHFVSPEHLRSELVAHGLLPQN